MPLFGKKKNDPQKSIDQRSKQMPTNGNTQNSPVTSSKMKTATPSIVGSPTSPDSDNGHSFQADEMAQTRPKLIFHCQQAHGSPTATISGFTNVKELYGAIAEAFKMEVTDILFCTLNTHKVDMSRLLGGQIGLDDFIFAHVKGRPKEVEVMKDDDALGLTITDNGAGFAFIKRIKEGSIVSKIDGIFVGDHIEKINGISTIGKRHFEVAKMLKELPRSAAFLLRVVEPMKSGFSNIGGANRGGNKKSGNIGTGKETLRLRSKGPAEVEVPDDVVDTAIEKINTRLESFLGINDNELAQTIWEVGNRMKNPVEFTEELEKTELAMFGFSDEFIYELWGDIGDAKAGRLVQVTQFDENF